MDKLARPGYLVEMSLPVALLVMVHTMGIATVEAQGRLPKPTLTMDPPSGAVTLGDNVTFTCTAPQHRPGMRFYFYKPRGAIPVKETPAGNAHEAVFQIPGHDGEYSCLYDIAVSQGGSRLPSDPSDNVKLTVKGRPPKPTLTMDPPSGAVTLGDNVTFTCTAPQHRPRMRFFLYKTVGGIPAEKTPAGNAHEAVFQIPGITSRHDGEYYCLYDITISQGGSRPASAHSNNVKLTVRAQAPQPVLLVSPVSVVEGDTVTLTCTAPNSVTPSQFTLYKDLKVQPFRESAHEGLKKIFQIKAVNTSDEGSYFCRYQTAQAVKSRPSVRVQLSVSAGTDTALRVSVAVVGALLLLALIGVLVWCVAKKAKTKQQQSVRSKSGEKRNAQPYDTVAQRSDPEQDATLEITYAELDSRSLRANSNAAVVKQDDILYASVVVP